MLFRKVLDAASRKEILYLDSNNSLRLLPASRAFHRTDIDTVLGLDQSSPTFQLAVLRLLAPQ